MASLLVSGGRSLLRKNVLQTLARCQVAALKTGAGGDKSTTAEVVGEEKKLHLPLGETIVRRGDRPGELKDEDINWEWRGFSEDPIEDMKNHRALFFWAISVCLVLGPVYLYYMPERYMRAWVKREGKMEYARRLREGGPLIDPNVVDPAKVILPPEEEVPEPLYTL
ncbi:NADH dehydrogenase [ubiquinone] 1 beta subcomplex subunit 11, mitochondrial-like [Branchiostoma lanceolatum]|uniref:NADH dehydrogenase [ubiquinone] 1 beta subcomplex subunit 11, mitochondrial-like n=1 Tax=Branchiostoma lanceolatum TaxID=7740 RepID=UPI0034569B62